MKMGEMEGGCAFSRRAGMRTKLQGGVVVEFVGLERAHGCRSVPECLSLGGWTGGKSPSQAMSGVTEVV
jgi:hypothetical protein